MRNIPARLQLMQCYISDDEYKILQLGIQIAKKSIVVAGNLNKEPSNINSVS